MPHEKIVPMEQPSDSEPPAGPPGWETGASVRVVGLVKAAQHNGKVGRLSARAGENDRIGVVIDKGQVLSVRRENLELLPTPARAKTPSNDVNSAMPEQRTLTRNNSMLEEFHGSRDPDVLVLYYHYNDRAFDCFNAPEYNVQMLRYHAAGITPVVVVTRKIRGSDYFLVCLQVRSNVSSCVSSKVPSNAPSIVPSSVPCRTRRPSRTHCAKSRSNACANSLASRCW